MIQNIFFILIILNTILCLRYQYLAKKLEIFDHPDNKLKIHKKKNTFIRGFFYNFELNCINYN